MSMSRAIDAGSGPHNTLMCQCFPLLITSTCSQQGVHWGWFKFANQVLTSRSACTQEKVQGLETQVQQLQEQLQAVQLENVHNAAQLQVGRSVAVLQTLCEASGTRTSASRRRRRCHSAPWCSYGMARRVADNP